MKHLLAVLVFNFLIILFSQNVIAQNYYYVSPQADFSTAGTSWENVTGCTLDFTPASTSENWIVTATGQVRSNTTQNPQQANVRLRVGGVVESEGGVQNVPANRETGFYMMHLVNGTTEDQHIDIEANRYGTDAGATVEQCSITAFKIPDNADFQWSEVDGTNGNCDDLGSLILNHTFIPSSAGDYLFITSFAAFENPGPSTIKAWIDYPISTSNAPDFNANQVWSNGRDARQTYVSIREETLTADPQSLTIECNGSNSNPTASTILWSKVASFRLDAWDADYHDEDLTNTTTSSSTYITRSTVTHPAPPQTQDFIMLGTISGCEETGGIGLKFREDLVDKGDAEWAINMGCKYDPGFHISFNWVEPYTTGSSKTWDNQYRSTDGTNLVGVAESAIHILRYDFSATPPMNWTFSGTLVNRSLSPWQGIIDLFGGKNYSNTTDASGFYNLTAEEDVYNVTFNITDFSSIPNYRFQLCSVNLVNDIKDLVISVSEVGSQIIFELNISGNQTIESFSPTKPGVVLQNGTFMTEYFSLSELLSNYGWYYDSVEELVYIKMNETIN